MENCKMQHIVAKEKQSVAEHFTKIFQRKEHLNMFKDFSKDELKVSWYMVICNNKGFIYETHEEIAKDMNMCRQAVTRAIQGLLEYGFICESGSKGKRHCYRLNPRYAKVGV